MKRNRKTSLAIFLFNIMVLIITGCDSNAKHKDMEVEALKREIVTLNEQYLSLNNKFSDLEKQYTEFAKEYKLTQWRLDNYKKIAEEYEEALKTLDEHKKPENAISGKVLASSETGNIVIISCGKDTGVRVGMQFTVYRADKYIGKIRVDKVEKEYSVAITIPDLMKESIKEGDNITTNPF